MDRPDNYRLSPTDASRLLERIRELHSFRELAALRLWLLESALPSLIPSDWFSYNEVDLSSPGNTLALMRPDTADFRPLMRRFAELSYQHPIIARQIGQSDLAVRSISDFLSRSAYHKLELYHDVYRPLEVEHQISAALETRRGFITAFALSRKRPDYTARDRAILEHLRGQLLVAIRNLTAADRVQALAADYARTLDQQAAALVVLDPSGEMAHYSGQALSWLGISDGQRVPAAVLAWVSSLRAGSHPSAAREMRLPHPEGEVVLQARRSARAEHMVVTLKLKPRYHADGNDFGLSAREAEVARWICEGKTNAQIAEILQISPRTVQKHLEHIFDRLGIESRVGVAIRMLA